MDNIAALSLLFPSAGSIAFLSWPFWVVWLLKASSDPRRIRFFVRIGVFMGILGICIFPQNMELITLLFLITENILPLLLFEVLYFYHKENYLFSIGWGVSLPLLVILCALMGFLIHSTLGIIIMVAAGTVLLAWWEGRQAGRAFFAWEMIRTRLCGMILASLGAGLVHVNMFHQNDGVVAVAFFKKIGVIFLVLGLVMMANLGKRILFVPVLGLLDTGLRFVTLFLLSRLFLYPFAHHVMFIAAFVGFVMFLLQREKDDTCLSLLTCLACFAASFGDEIALYLSFIASLMSDLLKLSFSFQKDYRQEDYKMIISKAFLPLLFVISIMIMRHMDFIYSLLLIFGLYFELRRIKFENNFQYPLSFWFSDTFWSQILILFLFIFSFIGILLLGWHPLLVWIP